MKTCKEIAKEWKMSERSIANLCKQGRIAGAVGKSWQIPDDVVRPVDLRRRETTVENNGKSYRKKPLPIGISDYVRAQAEYYYVDKTMLIKEFIDRKPLVSLFTRPRRFGKTLNMDMLRGFSLKYQRRIQAFISGTRKSGRQEKIIPSIKGNIR